MSVALVPLRLATVMVTPGYCCAPRHLAHWCRVFRITRSSGRLRRPIDYLVSHIAQIHRAAIAARQPQPPARSCAAGEKISRVDAEFPGCSANSPVCSARIRRLQSLDNGHGERPKADNFAVLNTTRMVRGCPPMNVVSETSGNLLECCAALRRQLPQLIAVVMSRPTTSAPESAHRRWSAPSSAAAKLPPACDRSSNRACCRP